MTDQVVVTPDSFKLRGYNVVHIRRWTGPEWARKGDPRIVRPLLRRFALTLYGQGKCYSEWAQHYAGPNKVINEGRDDVHVASFATTGQPKGFQVMALGKNTATPSCTAGLGTLTSEFTTPSGLARKTGTRTHTTGTNTSTIVATYSNNGAGATDVLRMGMYNSTAAGSGKICACNSFTKANLAINDQLKVTWTATLG